MIIKIKPTIKEQLGSLWNSFTYLNVEINKRAIPTSIVLFDFKKVDDMGTLSFWNTTTINKFVDEPKEQSHLLALFYCHVVRVDVFENVIKNGYEKLLEEYGLDKKFDPNRIFSINEIAKIKTKNGTKPITDVRAVRNCLAHKLYSVAESNDWQISFHSGQNANESTIYARVFTKNEFVDFLNDSNILFQSMLMLLHLFGAITYLKHFSDGPLSLLPYNA